MYVSVAVNGIVTVTSGDHCTTINSERGGVAESGTGGCWYPTIFTEFSTQLGEMFMI